MENTRSIAKLALYKAESGIELGKRAGMSLPHQDINDAFGVTSLTLTGGTIVIGVPGGAGTPAGVGTRFILDAGADTVVSVNDGVRDGQEIEVTALWNTASHVVVLAGVVTLTTGAAAGSNGYVKLMWTAANGWRISAAGIGAVQL